MPANFAADLSIYGQQPRIAVKTELQRETEADALQAKREAAQQAREKALDDAWMRKAVAESVDPATGQPDYQKASGWLAQSGRANAAQAMLKYHDEHVGRLETSAHTHAETQKILHEQALNLFNGIKGHPERYKELRPVALAMMTDPTDRAKLEAELSEEYPGDDVIESLGASNIATKDYYAQLAQAVKDRPETEAKWNEQTAQMLYKAPTQERWDQVIAGQEARGFKGARQFAGAFSPESKQQLASYLTKPHEAAQDLHAADTLAETSKNNDALRQQARDVLAETRSFHAGELANQRRNIAVNEHAEARLSAAKTLDGKPSTGQEKRALNFFNRAFQASDALKNTEEQIATASTVSNWWREHAPNFMVSSAGQQYTAAQRAFTEARLRKDSGAAIPEQEFTNDRQTYFVQPGDSAVTIKQKQRARQAMLASLAFESGRALGEFYGDDADGLVEGFKQQSREKTTNSGGGGNTTKTVKQGGHTFEVTFDASGKVIGSKQIK